LGFESGGGFVAQIWRYFNEGGIFRAGCLNGPSPPGWNCTAFCHICEVTLSAEILHFGYKGKQVRDNIHSHEWCARSRSLRKIRGPARFTTWGRPREQHFHAGGYRADRADDRAQAGLALRGRTRKGDHICYISNLGKIQNHYPSWKLRVAGRHSRRDHCVATRAVGADHGEMSTGMILVIEKAIVSLIEQDFSASER